MGKSSRNKKQAIENLNFFYQDIGTSSSAGGHLTQEEAAKEALVIRMSRKFALLEEERPIIKKMAYHDKYKKILNEVWKDKVELDENIIKEEEEATSTRECLSIWLGFIVFHCKEPTTHLVMLSRSMTSIISSTYLRHHSINSSSSKMMMSSVETTRVGYVTACFGSLIF
uniref:Uncharacterized protein n=1 Tax=Tanacetum cinerariifolium TaxID=118510 RepID=A0A6L2NDK8_TANCI|nr:hypothetical protein [Tanacetum cinerariifolium]